MRDARVKDLQGRVDRLAARVDPVRPNPQSWIPVFEQLSEDERLDLARAIMTLEKSCGTASLESLPPAQRAAWIKAHELYEKVKA